MLKYGMRVGVLGAAYSAATATLVGLSFIIGWTLEPNQRGWLWVFVLFWLPGFSLAGAVCGGCALGVAGMIIHAVRGASSAGATIYGILGGLLVLPWLLWFAAWVSGGLVPALQGERGSYLILFPGTVSTAVAGAFAGARIRRDVREEMQRGDP